MSSALDKCIPRKLLLIRQEHSLSQQQMADIMKISKPYYNRLENGGKTINDKQLKVLASHFSINEDELSVLSLVDKIETIFNSKPHDVICKVIELIKEKIDK